jgi:hypothetical protein
MAAKLSDAQRKVLSEVGSFGLNGGRIVGKLAQLGVLENRGLIEVRGVGKWAATFTGCECVGINIENAIDAIHVIALIENMMIIEVEELDAPTDATLSDELPAFATIFLEDVKQGEAIPSRNVAPTGPALTPEQRAAIGAHDAAYCYMGMAPIIECMCKEHVMEREIGALKVRVAELEAQIGLFPKSVYQAFMTVQLTDADDVDWEKKLWGIYDAMCSAIINRSAEFPIEQGYIDHAEIAARQSDYNEARDAGQGSFF